MKVTQHVFHIVEDKDRDKYRDKDNGIPPLRNAVGDEQPIRNNKIDRDDVNENNQSNR